jgi:hypothetical protein
MAQDYDCLSKKVERLERENLRLKRIGISLIIVAVAALTMGQSQSTKTVEANAFVLRGPDGLVRAKLDTNEGRTELVFLNDAGQSRLAIKASQEGEGLEMMSDSGELLATVSVAVQKAPHLSPTTSTIAVLGSLAGPGIIMNASKGIATVRVADQSGHRVWAASSQP